MLTLGVDNWGSQPYIRSTLHSSVHGGLLKDAELAPCRLQPRWLRPGKGGNWGHRGFWLPVRESRWSQGNCRAGNSPITGIIINVILVFLFPFHSNLGLIGYTEKLSYSIIYACSPVCLPIYIQEGERGEAVKRGSCFLLHSPASPRKSSSPLHQRRENFVQMLLLLRSIRIHSGYKNGSQLM